MTLSKALETLKWTTPTDPATLARRAEAYLETLDPQAPLRFKVAATTILRACR